MLRQSFHAQKVVGSTIDGEEVKLRRNLLFRLLAKFCFDVPIFHYEPISEACLKATSAGDRMRRIRILNERRCEENERSENRRLLVMDVKD